MRLLIDNVLHMCIVRIGHIEDLFSARVVQFDDDEMSFENVVGQDMFTYLLLDHSEVPFVPERQEGNVIGEAGCFLEGKLQDALIELLHFDEVDGGSGQHRQQQRDKKEPFDKSIVYLSDHDKFRTIPRDIR
jgi:hypothetical protein